MGGIITAVRDMKTIIRDLKVTLKITVKVVLKVHKIIDDIEETVNDLKSTVTVISSKVCRQTETERAQTGLSPSCKATLRDNILENIEAKAGSFKTSVMTTVGSVMAEETFGNVVGKWRRVLGSTAAATLVKACPGIDDLEPKLNELESVCQDLQPRIAEICESLNTINGAVQNKSKDNDNTSEPLKDLLIKGTKTQTFAPENILKEINIYDELSWLTNVHLGPETNHEGLRNSRMFENVFCLKEKRGELTLKQTSLEKNQSKELMDFLVFILVVVRSFITGTVECPNQHEFINGFTDQTKLPLADITEVE